ncbi:MAG: outer membrane beta-barrel protein [Bacteroides sp.]|nr:outer membrane beta-barrel protein [Bacteroides sp.]
MKKKILFILSCLWILSLSAQTVQLKGKIVCGTDPVDYANVVLQKPDSTFVTGMVTDQRGHFVMNNLSTGNYRLQISAIGYEPRQILIEDLRQNRDLGAIAIDSASVQLSEVTVTASHIIHILDKKIILPTSHQLKASTNGLNLLQQMKLSRLQVDPFNKKISSSGQGEVQVRINGAKAEIEEVMALRPEDVLRIEYHDDPSLRYGEGIAAVIDYIVRRRETGGYISLDLQNSPHIAWGNNGITAKINHKKSEYALTYYGGYRGFNHTWRENEEGFVFANGSTFTRLEEGIPHPWRSHWDFIRFNYSYQETDKWFFNAAVRTNINYSKTDLNSLLYPENHPKEAVHMVDLEKEKSLRPSVDLYFQRNLPHKQFLILNVVGTYIDSKNDRWYEEGKDSQVLTDIFSSVDGDRYSLIGEGIYEKGFRTGKLSTGLYFRQSNTDNTYRGTATAKTKLKESASTAYMEYTGKINRLGYSVGLRGNRTWIEQGERSYSDFSFTPQLRLSYAFTDHLFMRYRGSISQSTPSLSDLSDVEQLIDSLQLRRGNPNLKIARHYNNVLYLDFHKGLFSSNLSIAYYYQHRPIMESTYRENDLFVRSVENQRSWYKLNPEAEFKLGPIKNILTFSFTTGINHYKSRGNNYQHIYNNWYYQGQVMANYKNWAAIFMIQNHKNNFYGETLSYGENIHGLMLNYRHKQMTFGVMMFNPFADNYKVGSQRFNEVAPAKNWRYIKESSRMVGLTFAWNFSFGRKVDTLQKRLNHEDTESGVMKTGK